MFGQFWLFWYGAVDWLGAVDGLVLGVGVEVEPLSWAEAIEAPPTARMPTSAPAAMSCLGFMCHHLLHDFGTCGHHTALMSGRRKRRL